MCVCVCMGGINEVTYVKYQLSVFLTMTDYICIHIHIHPALKKLRYTWHAVYLYLQKIQFIGS